MLTSTVSRLCCPRPKGKALCTGELKLAAGEAAGAGGEVRAGRLECVKCRASYPILNGVAILVPDVRAYLAEHVKGISRDVPEAQIPREHLAAFREARDELDEAGLEHIEEDLEAERVISLYFMNHYLRTGSGEDWWKPRGQQGSPLIDSLVRDHWDRGPFKRIAAWLAEGPPSELVELGCSVGGLYPALRPHLRAYLGVDSSFASVALARQLALGFEYGNPPRIPEDLLQGPVSRKVGLPKAPPADGTADFVVGDLALPPLHSGGWDVAVALNAIDMLEDPSDQPALQYQLLRDGGLAVHACPYIWHEAVARVLRTKVPKEARGSSSAAAEWLYSDEGFKVEKREDHVPWLFLKHARQLEIYSVHLLVARKVSQRT